MTLAVAHFSTAGIALATAQFDVACAAAQAARDSDNDVALPDANVNVTAPLRFFGDFSAAATVSATR